MALMGFDFTDPEWALERYQRFINAALSLSWSLAPMHSWEYAFVCPFGKAFLNTMSWDGVLDLTPGSIGLKFFDNYKELRGRPDWDLQLRASLGPSCLRAAIQEYYQPLIAKAEESDEHETAAFLRHYRLLFLEISRNRTDFAEIQPHLHWLFHMCVLTDERQPAPYRLQAGEYLKELIKKPVFHERFRLIKDDIRSLAAVHGKEPDEEFDNHKLANLFMAAKEAVDSAKQAKSFVPQIQRNHQALLRKLNDLMTDDFAPGWRERARVDKQSLEAISDINDIHQMIETKEMASYLSAKLAVVSGKSTAEVGAAIVEAEDNYTLLAERLGISRRTLGRALSELSDELKS
jgi:hypothetical protein